MTEYRVRVDTLADLEVTRDDVAGVTRIDMRDRCQRTIIELPDVTGPDMLLTLTNQCVRMACDLGYGHEVTTPEMLARDPHRPFDGGRTVGTP